MVTRRVCRNIPKHLIIGLYLAAAVWGWNLFKIAEPSILPVVSGFAITEVDTSNPASVGIRGIVTKTRDCRFIQLAAYSGKDLVNVHFTETQRLTTRVPGAQSFGWWIITPSVSHITLYADHECSTGSVRTKIFSGLIKGGK